MEVESTINKSAKTRLSFNDFIYTWIIENYNRFQNLTENVIIKSPTITVHNDNQKYEFQLQISTYSNDSSGYAASRVDLYVISCTTEQTTINVRLSIVKRNEIEYSPKELQAIIKKNSSIMYLTSRNSDLFAHGLCCNDLRVKCKISFRNGYTHIEAESPDLAAARALSKMSILDELENLLDSEKFTDVTLIVGTKKFSVHKAILASRSPVFLAMFEHEMLENKKNIVEITDIEPEIMTEILRFIYSSKVKNIEKLTSDLLCAADKYQLDDLRLMCEEVFIDKMNFNNLEEILKIVDKYETCQRMHDALLKYLSFNGKAVTNWEKFDKVVKTLSPSFLFKITKAALSKS